MACSIDGKLMERTAAQNKPAAKPSMNIKARSRRLRNERSQLTSGNSESHALLTLSQREHFCGVSEGHGSFSGLSCKERWQMSALFSIHVEGGMVDCWLTE